MLLHGGKSEDNIKNFFNEVYELYVKVSALRCCWLWMQATLNVSVICVSYLEYTSMLQLNEFFCAMWFFPQPWPLSSTDEHMHTAFHESILSI
jgi:hypothetical protein